MSGSSPLARGTRRAPIGQGVVHRFIPARAGNTALRPPRRRDPPVHPRSRGEHMRTECSRPSSSGSSPLARGTRARPGVGAIPHRFIPARAGNTDGRRSRRGATPVHPRSRGEHDSRGIGIATPPGSSPLARGTRQLCMIAKAANRFIPARAGNTSPSRSRGNTASVHPRSRGEHLRHRYPGRPLAGSSPLARGTPRRRRGR